MRIFAWIRRFFFSQEKPVAVPEVILWMENHIRRMKVPEGFVIPTSLGEFMDMYKKYPEFMNSPVVID